MLSKKQGIFSLKMSTSSKSFNAACLLRLFFYETSKYKKMVVSSWNCDCVKASAQVKLNVKKQSEQTENSNRCFWFLRLL